MVKNFKGVVKVADVQAEFDNLLSAINNKIDTYNSSLDIGDVDYNNGGSDLAAYGYTLSVGGLKKILEAYNGSILGANVLRVSNNQYAISEGLYITNEGVKRLPSQTLSGSGNEVYFDESTNQYSFSGESGNRIYPGEAYDVIIFPPGTYPAVRSDHNQNPAVETETTVTFSEDTEVVREISNAHWGYLQTSTCKMTAYAASPDAYNWNSLNPSCLLDSAAPQHNDIYLSDINGAFQDDRAWAFGTLPADSNFGNRFIYGIKVEFNFPEECNDNQTISVLATKAGGGTDYFDFHTFTNWKFQTFAYNANGELLTTGEISSSGGPAYISSLPSDTRKLVVCLLAQENNGTVSDIIGNLSQGSAKIEARNLYEPTYYINTGIECELVEYISEYGTNYGVRPYSGRQNTLLGSIYFTPNTNTMEYIVLGQSGDIGNIHVSAVNANRISRLCNKPNAVNESIPDYKMTIESKNSGYVINGNQTLSNSQKGQFFSGSAGRNCAINLLGTQVAYHHWGNDRSDSYHEPINFLFVPKGIPNPYSGLSGETRFAMQKVFNYILKRPNR